MCGFSSAVFPARKHFAELHNEYKGSSLIYLTSWEKHMFVFTGEHIHRSHNLHTFYHIKYYGKYHETNRTRQPTNIN